MIAAVRNSMTSFIAEADPVSPWIGSRVVSRSLPSFPSLAIFALGVTCGWILALQCASNPADVAAYPIDNNTPSRRDRSAGTASTEVAESAAAETTPAAAVPVEKSLPVEPGGQNLAADTEQGNLGPGEPKPATAATRHANAEVARRLALADRADFEDASRGLIAPLDDGGIVTNDQGRIVWNLPELLVAPLDQAHPDTVHPGLWRQSQLLGISGLFKVTDRIYQVRGLDLANITFIEGDTGLIVVDTLLSRETAAAALKLYREHRPARPVCCVLYTHSHADHFGGVTGIVTPEEVAAGKVKIVAPEHFLDEVANENVLAGNAMQRRAGYMYGGLLPKSVTGDVGNGLGLGTSSGTSVVMKPTVSIGRSGEKLTIDGLTFEFLLTPGSEAPAEMHFYISELKALCPAENATHTMHNLYTLRGAKVRDARAWVSYLQQTIDLFGDRADVLFAPHHWPVWQRDRVVAHLTKQRDLYKYIHDQTLRLANRGGNMTECAEQIELPAELEAYWSNRGYYGSLNHNVKAVWNFYLGWFDGNPARLHPLPPREAGRLYVDFMGGLDALVAKARNSFERGEYRWVAQVLDHAVCAAPDHLPARTLLADALEQLGYQSESGPWRNFYLTGARELRLGVQVQPLAGAAASRSVASIPLPMIFDSLAVRLNPLLAAGNKVSVNFRFTDTGEDYLITQQGGVMHHFPNRLDENADCTVRTTRAVFDEILDRRTNLVKQIARGQVRIFGSPRKLQQLFRPLEQFDQWFNIMGPASQANLLDEPQGASQ